MKPHNVDTEVDGQQCDQPPSSNLPSAVLIMLFLHLSLTKGGSAPVALSVECPLRETGGHGCYPGPRQTKVVKNLAWHTDIRDRARTWSTQCQDNVTGCGIMSSVWGMIFQ